MKTPEVYVAGNQFYYVCLKLSFFILCSIPPDYFQERGSFFFPKVPIYIMLLLIIGPLFIKTRCLKINKNRYKSKATRTMASFVCLQGCGNRG